MNNPYLLVGLEQTPKILRRLFSLIPPDQLDTHPDPERFSMREALCHLADWEPIFVERLKGTIEIEGYQITPYDEGSFVQLHAYHEQEIGPTLDKFERGRRLTIAYLRGVSSSDWGMTAFNPERGEMSVADQAGLILGHDLYHIEHFSQHIGS